MLKQCMHLFCTYFDCILFNWHFQKQEDAKQIKEFPPSSNLYFSMRDRLEIKNVYVRCAKCHSEKIIRERRSGTKRGKAKYNLIRGVIRESLYAALHLSKYGIVHFTILHGVFIFYLLTTHHSFSVTASLRVPKYLPSVRIITQDMMMMNCAYHGQKLYFLVSVSHSH